MKKILLVLALVALTCTTAFAGGGWTGTVTIPYPTDNTTSGALAVPRDIIKGMLWIPTFTSSTVKVTCSYDGVTYGDLQYNAGAAAAPAAFITGATTGGHWIELPVNMFGSCNYVKVVAGTAQAAARTLRFVGQYK